MKMLQILSLIFMVFVSSNSQAKTFKIGDTIIVAFPANDIKSDAYMIGIVRKITVNGDYQISVRDFVDGHDYGLSCTPIALDSAGVETAQSGWEIWTDTRNPMHKQLELIVPAEKAMKLSTGKLMFIERYNIYITYSRWKSNAPIMTIGRIESVKDAAIEVGISAINPAFDIAILDRNSYFDPNIGRPYWPYESIKPLTVLLEHVQNILDNNKRLNQLWSAKNRDWVEIEKDMETYFLLDAIDKVVTDAKYLLNEDGLEKANAEDLALLKKQLQQLKRD